MDKKMTECNSNVGRTGLWLWLQSHSSKIWRKNIKTNYLQ